MRRERVFGFERTGRSCRRCALQQMRRIVSPREAYRYWADSFDEGTPILALESRQLLPVLPEVAAQRFLDIGCGTGRWLHWAIDRGAHAFGADLSHEMLRVAAAKPALSGRVIQTDAMCTPFRDASADVVVSALVIGHLRPISTAMAELARIAAPGAIVIVSDFHPDALKRGWKRTFKSGADSIEMESEPYPISELAHDDLILEKWIEPPFGEQERHYFEAAGKLDWFNEMRDQPAIVIARYRRAPLILRGARVAIGPEPASRASSTSRFAVLGSKNWSIDVRWIHRSSPPSHHAGPHQCARSPRLQFVPAAGPSAVSERGGVGSRHLPARCISGARASRNPSRNVRLAWGAIKSLISGVTTVAHHDPDPPRSFGARFPVNVAKRSVWIHSLEFTPDIAERFRRTPRDWPFILHLGEATDAAGEEEIFTLDRMGLLDERTVIVHGVALGSRGVQLMRQRGASLIACPVSNLFTLSQTLKRSVFSSGLAIALGTDSAITATGDLLDHLRAARAIWNLSAAKLYRMVTETAAQILHLNESQGAIRENGIADLIVIRDQEKTPAQSLLDLRHIEMAIVGGRVRLVSNRLTRHASCSNRTCSTRSQWKAGARVDRRRMSRLYRDTASRLGEGFKLAGKRVRIDQPK